MRAGRRAGLGGGAPVVLFLNDELWHCFSQLAAALRREGVAPVRVVTGATRRGRFVRLVERLLYAGVVDLGTTGGIEALRALVRSGRVVDAQVNEQNLAEIGLRSEVAALVAVASGVPVEARAALADKHWLALRLEALGIAVPAHVEGTQVSTADAAAVLGFPIVVKRRIGTGGTGVRMAHDQRELDEAVSSLGGVPSTLFFQRFVEGRLVGYGAVRGQGRVLAEFTARESKGVTNPLGPTVEVETDDDERLARLGRHILSSLDCRGLAALEFIADDRGTLWMVDLATRAWGAFLAFAGADVDFTAAYAALVRNGASHPAAGPPRRARAGLTLRAVPAAAVDEAAVLPLHRLTSALLRDLWPYARRLGLRYCVAAVGAVVIARRDARARSSPV